jgi:hypothetical protein
MLDSKKIKNAIQDSKTIEFLLSWIAKLLTMLDSKKKKIAIQDSKTFKLIFLLSRIAKQLNICFLDSKTLCYPG